MKKPKWPRNLMIVDGDVLFFCPFCLWSLLIPGDFPHTPEDAENVDTLLRQHLHEHVEEMIATANSR